MDTRARCAWLPYGSPDLTAAVRLFCFHHAGGKAAVFREWQRHFPAQIQVCPVEIPGHGTRMPEWPLAHMSELIEALEEGLGPWLTQPFAFFGHSMGAAIAFELVHRLRERRGAHPACLFVAGRRAPGRPQGRILHELPEPLFVEEIRRLNGTPQELLDDPAGVAFVVPMLRADFALVETHGNIQRPPLDCPIAAFGGADDPDVSRDDLMAWRAASSGEFSLHVLPGGHFFVSASRPQLIQILNERLATIPRGARASASVSEQPRQAGPAPRVKLPFERDGRPDELTRRVTRVTLPSGLIDRLDAVAAHYDVQTEWLMLAAWHALLWRLTRAPSIEIGVRRGSATESVRVDLAEEICFIDLARRCRQCRVQVGGQDLELAYLFSREQSLYDVLPGGDNRFKLLLNVHADVVELCFDTESFLESDAGVLAEQYATLLTGAAAAGQSEVLALPINSAAHHDLLRSPHRRGESQPVVDLVATFERRVREAPSSIALVAGTEVLTYRDLNARSNQLARYLRGVGVVPEARVALCLPRESGMLIAILAVLKAGGAYVPVEPDAPRERLSWILRESSCSVLVTLGGAVCAPGDVAIVQVDLEKDSEHIAVQPADNMEQPADPETSAYVIYTSGSTGRPKGVVVTRRNVGRLFQSTERLFNFSSADVWSMCHSYAFDYSVWEIWGAWLYGGKLVLASRVETRSPELLHDLLDREKVTVLSQTPTGFRVLAAELERIPTHRLHARVVVFGGEALDPSSLAEHQQRFRDTLFVNMYGITETTVHSTWKPLTPQETGRPGHSPVGVELADLRIYLLNRHLQEVGLWEMGEIYIGGGGVARCYIGRPELTAERFVPEPDGLQSGQRMYRSGDLARRRPDGELEFVGRGDHQVKIHGYRVELGEIESVLRAQPEVRDAAVVLGQEGTEVRLVAYLVTQEPQAAAADLLRQRLQEALPDYMVPAAFVFVDKIPLTSNGKVDKQALPNPDQQRPRMATAYYAPRTRIEQVIASIWKEVLRVETVGVQDNFFDIGGHSMRLIQVQQCLRKQLEVNVSTVELFAHPTISSLGGFIANEYRAGETGRSDQGGIAVHRTPAPRRRKARNRHRAS